MEKPLAIRMRHPSKGRDKLESKTFYELVFKLIHSNTSGLKRGPERDNL
jgi:hypothetical protein